MHPYLFSFLAVLLVSFTSFVGAFALVISENKLRRFLHYFISFSVGALLGEVFLHLLPEMGRQALSVSQGAYILLGVFIFLILEKIIRWHHNHDGEHEESVHAVAWLTLIGDGLHNVLDGMLIGASFLIDAHLGIATTVAVLFHEIPHELGDFMVLLHGGMKASRALWYNFLSALTSVVGLLIVWLFTAKVTQAPDILLGIGAASFLYIAMADLIPELNRERSIKRSIGQSVFLVVGVMAMAGLLILD